MFETLVEPQRHLGTCCMAGNCVHVGQVTRRGKKRRLHYQIIPIKDIWRHRPGPAQHSSNLRRMCATVGVGSAGEDWFAGDVPIDDARFNRNANVEAMNRGSERVGVPWRGS